jgi:fatty acid desaturase
MGKKRSYFRVGLSVAGWLFCALWLWLTIRGFFHFMERADDDGTLAVIWAFMQAAYLGLVYLLFFFWWLVIPVLGLPPFIGSMLDEREAIKARESAGVE